MASHRDGPLDYAFVASMFVFAGLSLTEVFGGPDVLGDWTGVVLGSIFIAWFSSQLRRLSKSAGQRRVLRIGQAAGALMVVAGFLSISLG